MDIRSSVMKSPFRILVSVHLPTFLSLMPLTWVCNCGMRCVAQSKRSDEWDGKRDDKIMTKMLDTCHALLCDRGARQVLTQGTVLRQVCRRTHIPRQGGCLEDKGGLGAVEVFYQTRTARAHMMRLVSLGFYSHGEHVLVPVRLGV